MNYQVTPLFAIPLFTVQLPPLQDSTKKFILQSEYTRFPAGNGYGTASKYYLDQPELRTLRIDIMKACSVFLKEVLDVSDQMEFQMTNSWAVKHVKGDESGAHVHDNAMLSGVYYVQTDEHSGDIVFQKDKNHHNVFTPTVAVPFNNRNHNCFNTDSWMIKPKDNLLILFPSTLDHGVMPSQSNQDRYCVAFNLFAFGKFGYDQVTQLHLVNGERL